MGAKFVFEGLEELKAELRNLPEALADEGGAIVAASGDRAVSAIRSGYSRHRRSGSLEDKVSVSHRQSRHGATSVVRSADRDALVFEVGSQARHTRLGANRGTMPPGNVFVPAVRNARREMFIKLKSMLMIHGLKVTDDAG